MVTDKNDIKDVSCESASLLIQYAQEKGVDNRLLFLGIESFKDALTNPREWIGAPIWIRLAANIKKALGDAPSVLFEAGKYITKTQTSQYILFFLRIAPFSLILKNIPQYMKRSINHNMEVRIEFVQQGELNIHLKPIDRSRYSSHICDFNIGCALGSLGNKGFKNLAVTEKACVARDGAEACHYRFTWTPRHTILNRLRDFINLRLRDYNTIVQHMDENHQNLKQQYREIVQLKNSIEVSRNFYRHLMENIREGIAWLNVEGVITFANRMLYTMLGRQPDSLVGTHFCDLLQKDRETLCKQGLLEAQKNKGIPVQNEFILYGFQAKELVSETTILWTADENQKPGFLVSVRDVTETKRLHEQVIRSQRMEILGQLAGGLAHDFNNNLIGINSYSQLLLSQTDLEKVRQYAETIHRSSLRASDLIAKLRSFSRGDKSDEEIFNLNTIAQEVADLMVPVVKAKNSIELDLCAGELIIKGSAGKIHQCLLNLCMNAKDAFITGRPGKITITTQCKEEKAVVKVSDNGTGMPQDIVDKIFDPFFTTKGTGGLGLGLSVVYGVVQAHQGVIAVDSQPGGGTVFTITLPMASQPLLRQTSVQSVREQPVTSRGLVVIIDDESLSRSFCKETLEHHGYATIQFANCTDALEWFQGENAERVSHVVSDIILPDMDGVELVEQLRKRRSGLIVVFISGFLSPNMRKPSADDPVLAKPFAPADLIKAFDTAKRL